MSSADRAHVQRFDAAGLRDQFPVLDQQVNGKPLVYLDNAATTQKPLAVIDAVDAYYRTINSNVHRGAHTLADRATSAFEAARQSLVEFVNAPSREQLIFTRGTTEGINLVANAFVAPRLAPGDEILVSGLAHHSNIVPWQLVARGRGARVVPVPVTDAAELDFAELEALLGPRTRLLALEHVSNAIGTVHAVQRVIALAHSRGVPVLLDGAQSVAHLAVDVQALDVDFYAFSAHKVYGPTGIGALYGKRALLEAMPPWQGGGEMIEQVSFGKTTFAGLPYRFEAGTPHIAGAIGFGAAVRWFNSLDRAAVAAHEQALLADALERAAAFPGLRVVGQPAERIGVLSFLIDGAHPHDVGTLLDQQGIAVRAGHHCAQPAMAHFGIPGTVRASFAAYNTHAEVEALFSALERIRKFL